MADTQTKQIRSAVIVDAVEKFKLYVEVTDKGDLPSANIFLIQINDPTDPKEDAFARVVTIADFDAYSSDRATSVDENSDYYRVLSYTFYYDNLETAVNAQDVLKSRIDELVTDWEVYQASFETVSEITTHPRLNADQFNTLVDDYDTAVTEEATSETERDDAKAAYDDAIVAADAANTAMTEAQARSEACTPIKNAFETALNNWDVMTAAGTTLRNDSNIFATAGTTFYGQCTADPPTSGEKAIFQAAITTFNGNISTLNAALAANTPNRSAATSALAAMSAMCSDLASEYTAAQTAKIDADTDVADKRTAYENAQAAYEAAQSVTEAALAAVRALKPDWIPT